MKLQIKILTAVAALSTLFSCGDKWLGSIGPQDGSLNPDIIFSSESSAEIAVTGTYDLLKRYYGGYQDQYGYKSFTTGLAYAGNDLMNDNGWYSTESNPTSLINATSLSGVNTSFAWNLFYKVINNANIIISKLEGSSMSEDFIKATVAEMKALRGWAYFQLARLYQDAYLNVANPAQALGVPIYIQPTTQYIPGNPRSTLEATYVQILGDLSDENLALIPADQGAMFYRANQNVVHAWRAQVYLEMGKYDLAAVEANKAYQGYNLMTAEEYKSGFNTYNSEWIWGAPFQGDQALGYGSFFAFSDMKNSGSGAKTFFVNNNFVARFSATDCRQLFFFFNGTAKPTESRNYASLKFKSAGASYLGDYVYIRSAEMMLVEAEGLARSGNEPQAANVLFALQSARDPQAVKSGNTGQALIDEILIERRKELFGEVAVEFFDAKRLKLPIVKDGNHPFSGTVEAGNKSFFIYQIPLREMDNNVNIDGQQNPR